MTLSLNPSTALFYDTATKKKKTISHRHWVRCVGAHPLPLGPWSRRPIKPVYDPDRPDGRLILTASAFNQLGQYTSSPGRRGYCYAELAVFFPIAVAVTIASTHCAYPWRDGQAELAWVAAWQVT